MIRISDGLCKRGCDPVTGHRLRRSITSAPTNNANSSSVSAKAAQICQIYIDNFIRRSATNLSNVQIENVRRACITDVSTSGDTQVRTTIHERTKYVPFNHK